MERFIMFLNEAVKAKRNKTKYYTNVTMFILLVVIVFYFVLIIKDGLIEENELVIIAILGCYGLFAAMILALVWKRDNTFFKNIEFIKKHYPEHREEILRFLEKYSQVHFGMEGLKLKTNWKFFIKKAYETITHYEQNQFHPFSFHQYVLDINMDKTKDFYHHDTNEPTYISNLPDEITELFNEIHVDVTRPYKVETFQLTSGIEYTYLYPVFGHITNTSNYLIENSSCKPIEFANMKLNITECYIDLKEPAFLISIVTVL